MPRVDFGRRRSLAGVSERIRRRFFYLRSFGFSKYEAFAYMYIDPRNSRMRHLLEEQRWILREAAAYQNISVREAGRRMAKERDQTIDELPEGAEISEDYDPYYRLGYEEEEGERPWYTKPRKPIYA